MAAKFGPDIVIIPKGSTLPSNSSSNKGRLFWKEDDGILVIDDGTTWRAANAPTGKEVFTYTGSDQSWNVPIGVTNLNVKIWGAGGAGSGGNTSGRGGAGGYVEGTINVSGMSTLIIVVGQGGKWTSADTFYAGGGGGYSGIFNGSVSQANALAIAGAGGGSGDGSSNQHGGGGGGGGTTGGTGQSDTRNGIHTGGRGGSQTAGGLRGDFAYGDAVIESGSALSGGDGAGGTQGGSGGQGANYWTTESYGGGGRGGEHTGGNWPGGGGGGGYYGGGGGNQGYSGGGGGGSSYVANMSAVVANLQGTSGLGNETGQIQPPNASDSDYVAGVGTSDNNSNGGNGLVVFEYS